MKIRSLALMGRPILFAIRITVADADMKESHATTVGNMGTSRTPARKTHTQGKGKHHRDQELKAELTLSIVVKQRPKNI